MARTIEKLREQYNTKASPKQMGRGPGSRGGAQGKPKNMGATVARLFSYYKGYRHRLVAVLLMMLLTTVCSLVGGYFMAPIIDRLTLAVAPNAEIKMSAMERAADRMITSVVGADRKSTTSELQSRI